MSYVRPTKKLRDMPVGIDELACIYSALILADDDIPVTEDKIVTLLKAANVEVEPIWPSLYARALQGMNIRELVQGAASAGTAGTGGAVTAGTGSPAAEVEDQKQEEVKPPPEPEEDSDDDFGLSLFD